MRTVALIALPMLFANVASAATTEIPFRECDKMICIDVSLDGAKSRTLVLDTGDVNSGLMLDAAQSLNWKLEPIERDGKSIPDVQRGGEHEVAFGDVKIPAKFLVFDRQVFGDHPLPGDGTLAYTFFKDRTLVIDYPKHVLRLSDSSSETKLPGKLDLISFGKKGPPILVGSPFTVNGKSVHAQIDSCYTGTLVVYDASVDALGLTKEGTTEFFPNTDGGVNMLAAPARKLGFGSVDLGGAKPTMYFVGGGDNPVHQPDGLFEATVGTALLKHSVVTLDFHSMTMDVQPAS